MNNNISNNFLHPYFIDKSIDLFDLQPIKQHLTQTPKQIKRLLFCAKNQPAGYELISNQKIYHDGTNSKTAGAGTRVSEGYTPIGFNNARIESIVGDFVVCAGLADGININNALECPVACCIGESNIISIANQIHSVNPNLKIIITADNDTAGRRVLDRAPEWASVRIVSSAGDASDVAQGEGLEALRDELATAHSIPPVYEFMPAKCPANINNCSMSQAYIRLSRAANPADAAKIAFLIMSRESLKTPHLKSLTDVQNFIYNKSPIFSINYETLNNYRRYFDSQILKRKNAVLRQVTLSKKTRDRHDVVEVKNGYTISEDDFKNHDVVCLGWGMGSGKTQRGGAPFAELANDQNGSFLTTCHRKALIDELCGRLGSNDNPVYHYNDIVGDVIGIIKRSAVCLPSITKSNLQSIIDRAEYVFIDELDQTIKFLASTAVCRTQDGDARDVYDTLTKIISNAKKILVADAHLSNISIRFLENCREGERFKILNMPYSSGLNVDFMADKKPESYGKIATMLMSGERVWISCESKTRAVETANFISRIKRDFKTICITAENTGDPDQMAFLANPEQESLKYDAVIHSPVISSGISIEHTTPHFTHGVILGAGSSVKCTDAAQMMRRVRYLKNFTVCLGLNNAKKIENWDALSQGLEAATQLEGRTTKTSDFDMLINDIRVSDAILTNDFGAGLYWLLEHDGAKLGNNQNPQKIVNQTIVDEVSELTKSELIEGILLADDICADTRANIESQEKRTTAESLQILKNRFRVDLGLALDVPATADDVERWDQGRLTSKLKRFNACFMRAYEHSDNDKKSDLSLLTFRRARAVAYRDLFDGFNLFDPNFYICNATAQTIINRIIHSDASRYMYASLKIVSSKYAELIEPFKTDRRGNARYTGTGKNKKPIPSGRVFTPPSNPKSEVKKILESTGIELKRTKKTAGGENVWAINAESLQEIYQLNAQRNSQRKIKTID
tara:strand:- start:2018 stop:4924 length:2907 start_codon:yes stop_codon:yes gene_type:complete